MSRFEKKSQILGHATALVAAVAAVFSAFYAHEQGEEARQSSSEATNTARDLAIANERLANVNVVDLEEGGKLVIANYGPGVARRVTAVNTGAGRSPLLLGDLPPCYQVEFPSNLRARYWTEESGVTLHYTNQVGQRITHRRGLPDPGASDDNDARDAKVTPAPALGCSAH